MAVLGGLLVVLGAGALLFAIGAVAVALLPRQEHRREALAAAPAIGALVLIVALHWTSILLPAKIGVWLVLAAVVLCALHPTVRARLRFGRQALGTALVCLALAGPAVALGLVPLRDAAQSTVIQPTPNNDAYAFVTEADWLLHHSAIEVPSSASIPIGYQYVRHHLSHGLRIGQELVVDTVATVSRQPVDELYYPMSVLWVALIPGVVVAAGGVLGLRRNTSLVVGLVLSVGSLEMYQLFNENSAAALGVALAPLALATVADALDLLPGRRALPTLAAPFVLAGVVGAYAEYTPLLLPLFALLVVLRLPRSIPFALLRMARALLLSIALSPLAWWHAAKGTVFHLGEPFLGWVSPFLSASPRQFVVRWIGGGDLVNFGADRSSFAVLVFLLVLVGLAAALIWAPRRRLWIALLLASALLVTYLSTAQRITYSEQRAVLYTQPLLLLAAAAGFDAMLLRLHALRDVALRCAAIAVVVFVGVSFALMNLRSDVRMATPDEATLAHRTVDASFAQAAQWVRQYGGPDGGDVLAVSGDFFDQLWLAYSLRDQPRVAWATFEPAYVDIGPCRYMGASPLWDGRPRRYLLVDQQSLLNDTPSQEVASNPRFVLLRVEGSPVVVATLPQVVAGTPRRIALNGSNDMLVLAFDATPLRAVTLGGGNVGSRQVVLIVGPAGAPAQQVTVPPGDPLAAEVAIQGVSTRVEVAQLQPAPGPGVVLDSVLPVPAGAPPVVTEPATPPPLPAPCD